MPTFPDFSRRLQEMNEPRQRRAADTQMQVGGGIPRPRNLVNPMQEQPEVTRAPGVGRLGPENVEPMQGQLSTDGMNPMGGMLPNGQPATGTGPDPTTGRVGGTMMDSLRQNVANQVRYEDIAPKMEEIPVDPQFQGHEKHGFFDRVKAGLTGSYAAAQQMPNNQYAGIGGLLAGFVNPGGAERLGFETVQLPRARAEQDRVMKRNESRRKAFQSEIEGQTAVAKLNEANAPEYASGAGGENPYLYNKKDARDQVLVKGPDGQPMRNATVLNTEKRIDSTEEQKDADRKAKMAQLQAKIEAEAKELSEKIKAHSTDLDKLNQAKKDLETYRQSQQNNRAKTAEEGRNTRHNNPKPRGKADRSSKEAPERAPNVFQSIQPKNDSFEFKPKKQTAPTN